ncbi:MAG: hypothetical protein MUC87_10180 [Bacteroidia bacterium]|jgi:hypothetical protein|nr:hypothetical protein [Bacteroidia bacterium]
MKKRGGILLILLLAACAKLAAQTPVRDLINDERRYLSFTEDQTFDRARDFIRRDSTFYIGYLYEGGFRYNRATDVNGFRLAAAPLQKALELIERDYDRELRTRSNDIYSYLNVQNYHRDYGFIVDFLERAYQNIERPDLAIEVLKRYKARNLQLEYPAESNNTIAWIYHRNRMYTAMKFPFLKNSVKENNEVAMKYLDSALMKINDDAAQNVGLYDASIIQSQQYSVYHYKAILHTYNLEIDSAEIYYNILLNAGYYSSNNYANFCYMRGRFELSEEFYREAETRDGRSEKQTREYYYMRGILDVMRSNPSDADTLLTRVLAEQGSTPGYGWHNIGLARAQFYEGLTQESAKSIRKAANFEELHIGTTWGREQYSLCVGTFNYLCRLRLQQEYYFENDEWYFWLNPVHWYKCFQLSAKVKQQKLLLAGLLAANPERAEVVYSLFSSENLLGFDEVLSIIDGYGNEFFIDLFKQRLQTDKRKEILIYFKYFIGRLYINTGDDEEALKWLNEVLADAQINDAHSKLLFARTCEAMAMLTDGNEQQEWILKLYETYPQLLPYTDLEPEFKIEFIGDVESGDGEDLADALNNCTISQSNDAQLVAYVEVNKSSSGLTVNVRVQNTNVRSSFTVAPGEGETGGKLAAYRLFGIEKKTIGEPEEELIEVETTDKANADSLRKVK